MIRSRLLHACFLVLAAGAVDLACSRQNPAFLGREDGPPPADAPAGSDASTADAPAPQGDAAPLPDGGCVPGGPCVAEGNRCQIGATTCADGVATCASLAPAPNGAFCGLDRVCQDGSCIDCAAGTSCATGGECEAGRLDCSLDTGAPACVSVGPAPDGTTCAAGVCYGGQCNSNVCGGLANTPCDSTTTCDRNGCGADVVGVCVAKVLNCPPAMPPFAPECGCDGKTYLTSCLRLAAGAALAHPGACANATEDCYNGADDNGDGLADCADPQCQATSVCTPKPPAGWTGIGFVDPDGKPTCPPELLAQDLYDSGGLTVPTLTCVCECGGPSAHCAVNLTCYGNDTTCNGGAGNVNATIMSCASVPLPAGNSGCKAGEPHLVGGCAATTRTTRPAITWTPTGRACLRAAGGSCPDATDTCVPRAPGTAIGPCIARAGDYACPGDPYVTKRLSYLGQLTDNRTCTTCASCTVTGVCPCDPVAPTCGIGIFSDNSCSGSTPQPLPADNQCHPVNAAGTTTSFAQMVGVLAPTGTQCVPGVSASSGAIAFGPKITTCCPQ